MNNEKLISHLICQVNAFVCISGTKLFTATFLLNKYFKGFSSKICRTRNKKKEILSAVFCSGFSEFQNRLDLAEVFYSLIFV